MGHRRRGPDRTHLRAGYGRNGQRPSDGRGSARQKTAAEAFAAEYGIATAYGGYEALYADAGVDAIYVATPHTLHLKNAGDALRAGKAVLCEKPITINAAECEQLIRIANESGSYLMEAMWTWFLPAVRTAKDWVNAGRIGKVIRVQSDFGYPLPYSETLREYDATLGGGCLLEMGVYPVAFAALFADSEPETVQVVSRHAPNGVEDDVVATFNYADSLATIGTSFRAKLRNWAYIVGEDGYIAIPDFWRANECQLWVLDEQVDRFDDRRTTNGFDYQIRAVNDDLIAGRTQSETMPLASSLQIQRHMDLIRSMF